MAVGGAVPVSGEAKPYSKAQQLARGERRYRRKVASPKQWQAIIAAKGADCRVCVNVPQSPNGQITYHHLIPRDFGGDDVADNVIPLCRGCHFVVTATIGMDDKRRIESLLANLSDAEYAYAVGKAGEDWAERIYGLRYSRV